MDITISKKLKHIILMGSFLALLLSVVYYYIYTNDTYLMAHSVNLQTGSGTENCKIATSNFRKMYLCEPGYYQVTYPTHKKVFYYRYADSGGLGPYLVTTFIEGADIKTFKALNINYAIDKNNLYYTGSYFGVREVIKTPHTNLSNTSVFVDGDKYAKDNESVFFAGEKIPGANPSDFNFFVGGQSFYNFRFALSNGKIFHGNKPVSAVRDGKFFVYTQGKEIPFPCMNQGYYTTNGDPSIEGNYQCDITESGEDEKIDIDTESFEVINNQMLPYVKDKNYVYTCSTIGCSELHVLEGANPDTFDFGETFILPEDVYSFQDVYNVDRGVVHNGYISGCKVYKGFKPNHPQAIQRTGDPHNYSCVYSIYPDL